ncbi:hypothetical protein [Richelia intracellularis]|jgi:hypothetical protein|nr:hypothetical protein [Richelia intracellularis]
MLKFYYLFCKLQLADDISIMAVDITSLTDISTIKYQHQESHNVANQSSHPLPEGNLASIDQ